MVHLHVVHSSMTAGFMCGSNYTKLWPTSHLQYLRSLPSAAAGVARQMLMLIRRGHSFSMVMVDWMWRNCVVVVGSAGMIGLEIESTTSGVFDFSRVAACLCVE